MSNTKPPTPLEAYNLLVQLAKLPDLKLNWQDHTNIQIALDVLKPLVQEPQPKLTLAPESTTV